MTDETNGIFEYCEDCYDTEDGICPQCCDKYFICPNCVAYGNGGSCDNCLLDEGIDIGYFMILVHEWIGINDVWFNNIFNG